MDTRSWWLAMALLGVSAMLGCERDAERRGPTGTIQSQPAASGEGITQPGASAPTSFDAPPPVGTRAHCPVMGDDFTVTADTPRSEYQGRHYVFCCPACKPQFDANPQRYLAPAPPAQ